MAEHVEIPLHLSQVLEEELENLPLPGPMQTAEDGEWVRAPTVAEEENAAAAPNHGPPAAAEGRDRVWVRGDWGFHAGHVKDPQRLAAVLSHAAAVWSASHPGRTQPTRAELEAELDIYTFIAFRYRGLWDYDTAEGRPAPDLNALLNRILRDQREEGGENPTELTVFSNARLNRLLSRKGGLRREARALLTLGMKRGGAYLFQGRRRRWRGVRVMEGIERGGADVFYGEELLRPWPADLPQEEREAREESFAKTDLARFRRLLLEDVFPGALRRAYDLRLARAVQRQHAVGRSAVCFSGGGIRSGTFALGVIQSLAQRGMLDKFDYLSTVSGGGYIGGWLTAWIHRHPNGLDGVIKDLRGETRASKLDPEPEPLRHLRDYSNFITPRVGLLSADTWTFVVIYVRNLLLNWVVLIPLLASVLMIPRLINAVVLAEPGWRVLAGVALAAGVGVVLLKPRWKTLWGVALFCAPAAAVLLGVSYFGGRPTDSTDAEHKAHLLGAMLVTGTLVGGYVLAYMRLNRPSNSGAVRPGTFWDRHRDQTGFLWLGLLPLTVAALLLTTFWAWFRSATGPSSRLTVMCVGWGWHEDRGAVWSVPYFNWKLAEFGPCLKLFGLEVGEFTAFLLYGLALGLTSWLIYLALAGLSWVGATGEVMRLYKNVEDEGQVKERADRIYERVAKAAVVGRVIGEGRREPLVTAAEGVVKARALLRRALKRKIIQGVFHNAGRELLVTLAASVVGAVLLYVASVKISVFYDPVVEHTPDADPVVRDLLPYWRWYYAELYTLLAYPTYLITFFLGVTLFTGFTSRRWEGPPGGQGESGAWKRFRRWLRLSDRLRIEDEDREWLARASAWMLIAAAGWLFIGGLVLFGPLLFFKLGPWLAGGLGGAAGLGALLGGGSSLTPGNKKEEARAGWLKLLGLNLIVAAAFVFCCCIVIAVSLLAGTLVVWLASTFFPVGASEWLGLGREQFELFKDRYPFQSPDDLFRGLHFPTWVYLLLTAALLHAVGRFFALTVNLNKFSLHAGYRDRIIRAFLGASQRKDERRENPFTGFDPRDNLHMQELRPQLLRESDFRKPKALESFVAELNRSVDELKKREEEAKELEGRAEELERQAKEQDRQAAEPDSPAAVFKKRAADLREQAEGLKRDAQARRIALCLRDRISGNRIIPGQRNRPEGASNHHFKEPPTTIEYNPSFRAALFADLNRILQEEPIPCPADGASPAAAPGGAPPPKPEPDVRGAALISLNRERLSAAFPYIERPRPPYPLMHVVNMALNLVGGDRLAWQQRRAESFTASPLHSGSLFVGYRRTHQYGGNNGISLGTAVAISGAAASSNMGYFSPSVFVTFVLTFFNARLGWWLGNPGASGSETYFRSHPSSALSPLIDEAFGLTDDENPYVLLSDGGHFENLGLYEMVLRRCRYVVVVDGSADPGGALEGLGDAVRKIRIDLGVRIEFMPPFPILPRPKSEEKQGGGYCAVGDIHYEDVDDPPAPGEGARPRCERERHRMTGRIVYLKPTVYGTEPRDVFNYAVSHPDFPHESTADQFFDEPQFESYRMLGYHIVERLFEEARKGPDREAICEKHDLRAFVRWLGDRAETERREALGLKEEEPPLTDPGLPFC